MTREEWNERARQYQAKRKAKLKAEREARGGLGAAWDGNRPRWEIRRRLAKWYAKRHNVEGGVGGWIYSPSGRPIVQGWDNYYLWARRRIWAELDAFSRAGASCSCAPREYCVICEPRLRPALG